jgi:hypothetical protein
VVGCVTETGGAATVAVGEGDGERVGDADVVATDTTLCVGEGGVDVELAALPHPAASAATSASAPIFR